MIVEALPISSADISAERNYLYIDTSSQITQFSNLFEIRDFQHININQPLEPGYHQLIISDNTPEYLIRAIGWRETKEAKVRIRRLSLPLEFSNEEVDREFLATLPDLSSDFKQWRKSVDEEKLSTTQAYEVAQIAIRLLSGSKLMVELEQLRQRSNYSQYKWNKLITQLEEEYKEQIKLSIDDGLRGKNDCHDDNVLLSSLGKATKTPTGINESRLQSIEKRVERILRQNNDYHFECINLDYLYTQYKEDISKKSFHQLVNSCRVRVNEVLPEDEIRLKNLIEYSQAEINWDEVLPPALARNFKHDAEVLNIDPVMIWQALLSASSSLLGKFRLDEYGGVPAVNWTCTVGTSGIGKSRADNLVLSPLRDYQMQKDDEYKEQVKQYKAKLRKYQMSNEEGEEPEKPRHYKHLFETATIQALLVRLAEQEGEGALWARDEIKGLFSSLGQFTNKNDESNELLLSLWDNKSTFVDRVDEESSFNCKSTSLSITGGIQEAVFRKAFQDEEDGNGLQARFVFATPKIRRKRYTKGYCKLSDQLPCLYNWLREKNQTGGTVKLSSQAQSYFAEIVKIIGEQIEATSHAGIRNWLNKSDTHILRIALVLHLIECHYRVGNKDINTLTLDTLKRAVTFVQYYRSSFTILQEKVNVNSDDIASILLQIHSEALSKHPDGISARDVYRKRNIANRAKAAGIEASAYVVDLFKKMQELGYGEVTRKGRSVRFIAYKLEDIINVTSECEKDKEQFEVAENIIEQEQSPPPDPETITIVSDDNQKNTEILRGEEEIKEQYQPGDEVEFYSTPMNVNRDDRYQGTIKSIDYSNSFSATITFTCKQGKTRSTTLIDASLIVGLVGN